jgi:hypothetical protein
MKIITLLTLLIAVGCIFATGCVAQPKKDPVNTTVSPTNTFTPFVNTTTVPGSNITNATNATNATNVTPKLKGPLRVSVGSYSTDDPLPVSIDNTSVGVVKAGFPLDLMVTEGNHSVVVCVGVICPEKFTTVVFAKSSYLDFEEILRSRAEFSKPVIRILRSYKNGDGVGVELEYINPTNKDLTMSAELSVGYTYIDGRTNIRMGDSVRSKATEWVEAGRRVTRTVDLNFVYGSSYSYDEPAIIQTGYQ